MTYDVTAGDEKHWLGTVEEVQGLVATYRAEHGDDATRREVVIIELPKTAVGNGQRLDVSQFFLD